MLYTVPLMANGAGFLSDGQWFCILSLCILWSALIFDTSCLAFSNSPLRMVSEGCLFLLETPCLALCGDGAGLFTAACLFLVVMDSSLLLVLLLLLSCLLLLLSFSAAAAAFHSLPVVSPGGTIGSPFLMPIT